MEGPPGVMVMVGGTGTGVVGVEPDDEPPRVPRMMPAVATPPAMAQSRQSLYQRFFFTAMSSGVCMECVWAMVTLPVRVPIVAVAFMSKAPGMAFIK